MLALSVRGGQLEGEPWVYAWLAEHGVVYLGATALHPATRTWLHLHDEDPSLGRMRARYPELAEEELDVLALQLPPEVDRQQVRHGAVALLAERGLLSDRHVCDQPLPVEPTAQAEELAAAIEERLRR
jgi:hypothetical protein